jgi:Zn-dependent peptidase ImmA (M78 family)
MRVRYLPEEAIERDAETLLAEYSSARDIVLQPPIPVEDIVEKHLRLRIGFDDLHKLLGVPQTGLQPDIFGAIWMDEREIVIHECLDPDEWPSIEGRYRFTLAHEGGGHWRLHRPYIVADRAQSLLYGHPSKPTVICRSSQAKERVEWQADFYASCLLMPRSRVFGVWHQRFGNTNARILKRKGRLSADEIGDSDVRAGMESYEQSRDDQILEEFARPFAKRFNVSPTAMRIRLEKLGLLLRDQPRQRSLTAVA